MIAIAIALLSWQQPTEAEAVSGYATYYSPGTMDRVISNRGLNYADGVAMNRAGDLGRNVWLVWEDGTITGPLPVVDCAQRNHYTERERLRRVVEVSAELAEERGFYGWGPVPVTVLFKEPLLSWN